MKLKVLHNDQVQSSIDLSADIGPESTGSSFLIGRSDHCHIVLNDRKISREHIKIVYNNGIWKAQVLSNSSPTFINGEMIQEKSLSSSDSILVGPFTLQLSDIPLSDNPNSDVAPAALTEEVSDQSEESPLNEEPGENFDDENFSSSESGDEESNEFSEEESEFPTEEYSEENSEGEEYEEVYEDEYEEGDGGYELTTDDESTQILSHHATFELDILGEYAPFNTFLISEKEVLIGRDAGKCHIVLNDDEVSGVHAIIKKNKNQCVLEDQDSSNGTLLNGKRINQVILANGDEFIIGSSTFSVRITSDIIKSQAGRLMPVEDNQVVEVEEIVEVEEGSEEDDTEEENAPKGLRALFTKDALKDPEKRKKLLMIAVAFFAVLVLLPEEKSQKKKKSKSKKSRLLNPKVASKNTKRSKLEKKLSKEEIEFVEGQYLLAKELLQIGKFSETLFELEKIFSKTKEYKNAQQLKHLAQTGLADLEELARKAKEEEDRKIRAKKVLELVANAQKAVEERRVEVANALFSKVLELDPENFKISQLKIELDGWIKEQEKIALEKAQKEAERKRRVAALGPGKNFYLKNDWYRAINKLGDFLKITEMDDDLIKSAATMLEESKTNLKNIVDPLLGKAKSLNEGQDLKGAYEAYNEVLNHDPEHLESLNQMNNIREKLELRSRKLYREAIISESLSLFQDAKDKFQEVQQISPINSHYYKKATDKLKDYLE
jgi:pSer/pThr/pTyr-binding forkhead associated (FHA) protein